MNKYQELLNCAKALHKAEADVQKKSDKIYSMTFENTTTKRRAAASDALTYACFFRDKAIDKLHCELVDCFLVEPKPVEEYEPRQITHNAGFGHTIQFKYHPPKPKRITPHQPTAVQDREHYAGITGVKHKPSK